MVVYEAKKSQFLADNNNRDIDVVILQRFKATTGKSVIATEIRSWKGLRGYMAKVLRDEEIPDTTGVSKFREGTGSARCAIRNFSGKRLFQSDQS